MRLFYPKMGQPHGKKIPTLAAGSNKGSPRPMQMPVGEMPDGAGVSGTTLHN
jgi:hypothetical protein